MQSAIRRLAYRANSPKQAGNMLKEKSHLYQCIKNLKAYCALVHRIEVRRNKEKFINFDVIKRVPWVCFSALFLCSSLISPRLAVNRSLALSPCTSGVLSNTQI